MERRKEPATFVLPRRHTRSSFVGGRSFVCGTRCHSAHLRAALEPRQQPSGEKRRVLRQQGNVRSGSGQANGQSFGIPGRGSRGQTVGKLLVQPEALVAEGKGVAPPVPQNRDRLGPPRSPCREEWRLLPVAQCTVGPV